MCSARSFIDSFFVVWFLNLIKFIQKLTTPFQHLFNGLFAAENVEAPVVSASFPSPSSPTLVGGLLLLVARTSAIMLAMNGFRAVVDICSRLSVAIRVGSRRTARNGFKSTAALKPALSENADDDSNSSSSMLLPPTISTKF